MSKVRKSNMGIKKSKGLVKAKRITTMRCPGCGEILRKTILSPGKPRWLFLDALRRYHFEPGGCLYRPPRGLKVFRCLGLKRCLGIKDPTKKGGK